MHLKLSVPVRPTDPIVECLLYLAVEAPAVATANAVVAADELHL